jgi:hypothetical protein
MQRQYPSVSFPIHLSSIHPLAYSLDSENIVKQFTEKYGALSFYLLRYIAIYI